MKLNAKLLHFSDICKKKRKILMKYYIIRNTHARALTLELRVTRDYIARLRLRSVLRFSVGLTKSSRGLLSYG